MKHLFLDLLNSDWRDWKGSAQNIDYLDNPRWLLKYLNNWTLNPNQSPSHELREQLKELRSLLRRIIEQIQQRNLITDEDLASLNKTMQSTPLWRKLIVYSDHSKTGMPQTAATSDGNQHPSEELKLLLEPVRKNSASILAEITASFAAVLANGEASRIKICRNPDCGWCFYDQSRGKTRRWCDHQACGNLLKVRRFRARQKVHKS